MGVPALFRWLQDKYPKIITKVIEEPEQEVNGVKIPVDLRGPNPCGEEMDNLYLDMNNIVHPCSHPEDRPAPETEQEMMMEIFKYTERIVNMVRPRKLLMIAVDGVAPRAKMNQQRSRRFRSAQEAKEKDEEAAEYFRMFQAKSDGKKVDDGGPTKPQKTWDSNAITPGTPFMDILASSLRYWTAYKLNTEPAWAKLKVIISDATVPGEGEHKVMEFIRSQRSSPQHDPNTRHVIYGLDADLIMLGLATHEPHFRILREDVFAQDSKPRTCHICGQVGHKADECQGTAKKKQGEFDEKQHAAPNKPYIWLHVSVLREYLKEEMYIPDFPNDLERALDDWVFMCFFVGNDFLPHLPSLDIRDKGIDTLIGIWRDSFHNMGGYVTKDGQVDMKRAQYILDDLAKLEDGIFRRRRQAEQRREANTKRRKIEEQNRNDRNARRFNDFSSNGQGRSNGRSSLGNPTLAPPDLPLFKPGKDNDGRQAKTLTHEMVVNRGANMKADAENRSAAAALKDQMLHRTTANSQEATNTNGDGPQTPQSALGKRKAELMEDNVNNDADTSTPNTSITPQSTSDEPPPDTVRLWEDGYADRYYEQKFGVDPKDIEFRHKVARAYAEGLAWVLLYYFQGCPSWTWYYPYHYAPFAADFKDLDKMEVSFAKGKPFRPFEQLMGVLPAASRHTLPKVFHPLMTDEDSEIIEFYPEDFVVDLNGKKFAWQGVALLPWIDENKLLSAMQKIYPKLTTEEATRNSVGKDALLISDSHPLYNEIAANFFSKKQGAPKFKLNPRISEGLSGKVEKDEASIPQGSLIFPFQGGSMPDIDTDSSISTFYEIPKTSHIHKSMLLAGVQLPPAKLDGADKAKIKAMASRSGGSYGGAPIRGGYDNDNNFQGRRRGSDFFRPQTRPQSNQQGYGNAPHSYGPPPGVRGPTIAGPPPGMDFGYAPPGQGYGGPPPPPQREYVEGYGGGSRGGYGGQGYGRGGGRDNGYYQGPRNDRGYRGHR